MKVMKEIDMHKMDSRERKSTEVEVQVLACLKHPYIVRYTESFVKDHVLCIVMDYCEGGDLWQYIAKRKSQRSSIAEVQVLRWFTQMSLALKHMHDKNILHRDIKTQNVFLAKREAKSCDSSNLGCVKIADMGIAKVLDSQKALARTQVGTPYYLSPEICQHMPYNSASDMWALGCVLYELCALQVPFEAAALPQLMDKIVRTPVPRIPHTYSPQLMEIVNVLLSKRANDRPSAEKVLQKPMIQAEIKKMIDQNKKPEQGGENRGGENIAEDPRGRPEKVREHGNHNQPPRGVLQEHNHNPQERRPSSNKQRDPHSRAPSPAKEAAKQIIAQNKAPSRDPSPRQPQSAREYQHPSARHHHQQPQSARQGYPGARR